MKNNWVRVLGAFLVLFGLVLGLAPAAVLAQTPGPLDRVIVAPAAATLPVGGTLQFAAQGYDVNNVPIAGLTYFWVAVAGGGTITATGLFTAGNVAATYPNGVQAFAIQNNVTVKWAYASVTVTGVAPGPLDRVTVTPAAATLAMGGTQQFSAQGYDANNMAIPSLTYYWSVVAGGGTVTQAGLFTAGNAPGSYSNAIQGIAVQGSIVKFGTASVTVTGAAPGPLDRVTVTPVAATLAPGGTQQFSAQGYDASNVPIPGLAYYWSVVRAGAGSITPAGLFRAGSIPGPYPNAVQGIAVQGNAIIKFATASVTVTGVTPGALDRVKITPSSANVAVGGTRQFSAQGYDADNKPIPGLSYYWSVVVAGAGTITPAGLFQAGNVPNSYPNAVQAIALQNGNIKYATASVTVTAAPQPTVLAQASGRLILLVAASLRGIAFEDFLGGQWTEKENGTTYVIKAIPGTVNAISSTSVTLLPNGQAQTLSFALTADTVVLAKDGLKVDEKAVVVTVNDQTRLVLEVPIPSPVQLPPGIRKEMEKLDKFFDKFEDRFTPPGWDKGKKTGWDRDWDWDWDWDDD